MSTKSLEQSEQPEVTDSPTSSTQKLLEQRYTSSIATSGGATLDLSSLGLEELPPLSELAERFPRLRQLNVRRNALQTLPDDLARAFPQLVTLNASENALETLSTGSIGALRHLQRLYVAHNRLRELPAAVFARLDALEELDARGNLLELLAFADDDEMLAGAGLRRLQVLRLANNRLKAIAPAAAELLPSLRVVDLAENPELVQAPEKLRRLHERHLLLHSRAKRRELITRALRVRQLVTQSLATVVSPVKQRPAK